MLYRLVPLVLSVSFFASSTVAQNWPRFRGPEGRGTAAEQGLPESWNLETGENVCWRTPVPGLAHSSPIVWGDRVYVTTAIAEDTATVDFGTGDVDVVGSGSTEDLVVHSWEILALEKTTGAVAWRTEAHRGVPRVKRHVKASHASATPVTDGRMIVALFGSEGLFAFEMDGSLKWRTDIGLLDVGYWGERQYQWAPASSPVIHENLVIVQNDRQEDSFLAAYDLETGREVWRAERDEKPAWSTPVVHPGVDGSGAAVVTNGANFMRANDPATGLELWRVSHEDLQVITPSPIVAGDLVIVTGGNPNGAQPIYAFRSGEVATDAERTAWRLDRGSPYTPTPLAYGEILYVITDNGILSAYALESGERLYRARLAVGAGFSASPIAVDSRIYFPSEDGEVFIVRAGDTFELLGRVDMGQALMASPAVSDGVLYLRGREEVFAIGHRH